MLMTHHTQKSEGISPDRILRKAGRDGFSREGFCSTPDSKIIITQVQYRMTLRYNDSTVQNQILYTIH